jgi:putative tricarboxylic transport membrane protein
MVCMIGAYSLRNSMFDIGMTLIFGIIGYFIRKYGWPTAPLILCGILGPILEKALVNSLAMSAGSPMIFFTRPICLALLIGACGLLIISLRVMQKPVKEEY